MGVKKHSEQYSCYGRGTFIMKNLFCRLLFVAIACFTALVPCKVSAQFALNDNEKLYLEFTKARVEKAKGNPVPLRNFFINNPSVLPLYPWSNTDLYQIWERLDSICSPTLASYTHYNWRNTDLYQIWLKLDSCFSGSPGDSTLPAWALVGNNGTNDVVNFLGTIDNVPLTIRTFDKPKLRINNSPFGQIELVGDTDEFASHHGNHFVGFKVGLNAQDSALYNIGFGYRVLELMTNACRSSAFGAFVLGKIQGHGIGGNPLDSSYENSGFGYRCMEEMLGGFENSAHGAFSMQKTTSGHGNSAFGLSALQFNTTGNQNTAVGVNALLSNTTATVGTAVGYEALRSNTTGGGNTAVGLQALFGNTTGINNTAIGAVCATNITTGGYNFCAGIHAGDGITTESNNVMIGPYAGALGSHSFEMHFNNFQWPTTAKQDTHEPIIATLGADSSSTTVRLNGITQTYALTDLRKTINTTAGDAATIDAMSGRFTKDTSGATFTLTNGLITANSIIVLTAANAAVDATAVTWTVSAGSGSATITFVAAPTANFDMNFFIVN